MTADQLRKSILQQAIQGKLVPQDPNDEPASVLLERIREEKARLVEEKKIKKEKNPSVIFRGEDNSYYEKFTLSGEVKCIDEEIPFEIPNGWEWCRLGIIGDWGAGATPLRGNIEYYGGKIPWLKTGELNNGLIISTEEYITDKALEECSLRLCNIGDILIAMYGATIGKLGIAGIKLTTNQACCACTPIFVYNKFLFYFLMASKQSFIEQGEGGAQPNISRIKLVNYLFPLPPLKEQQRIVEKIEELIPHIELYGKAQTELDTLNKNIKEQLKKSVLQYAIEGKLVPQDEAEGSAEELLLQIQAEKQKLYEENKLKKKDLEHSIIFKAEDNKYYEKIGKNVTEIESDYSFPNSWAVTRLSSICILTDGEKKEGQNICLDAKFLRGKTEGDYLQKGRFVEKGDNIILVDGENSGEVFTIPRNGYMGSTFKKLWVNPVMDLQYVLHFIQFYKDLLRNSKKGAAIPHLNKELFYSLLIGIPPLSEQQRIVNTIQNIFRCIEKN